jgi:hypothetical protein
MRSRLTLFLAALLTGCSVTGPQRQQPASGAPVLVVASALEPAAQFNGSNANYVDGALVGAAGGAGVGAMSGYSSAGLLCTIGGPLCLAIVVPVALVGGVVGGVAGDVTLVAVPVDVAALLPAAADGGHLTLLRVP